jgi:hypothetical protein
MKNIKIIYFLILIATVSCKKYPKNWLLFKSPEKTLARGVGEPWLLESYTVNNVDSTFANFLTTYKNEGLVMPETAKKSSEQKYYCFDIISGYWEFTDKKKTIHFKFSESNFYTTSNSNTNYSNQRNIFMKSGLGWKINKLSKNGFWVETEFNNNKYEIHFK